MLGHGPVSGFELGVEGRTVVVVGAGGGGIGTGVCTMLVRSGATVLGLAALDERADPAYDRHLGEQMAALGCHVGAMTPGDAATAT